MQFQYQYFISDGATYAVSGNLTITCSTQFASNKDQLGNPYQVVTGVTGTRTYTYIPTSQTQQYTVNGLSLSANPNADQRFFPYSLIGSSPGVYTTNTAPYFDSNGIEFNISPAAPENGLPLGVGTQYTATSLYMTTPEPLAVLTEGFFTALPTVTLQRQIFTLPQ